jgi:hypothetical protein
MPTPADPRERPDTTPANNVEEGVIDTFPASDAVANTATQGARAVPPEQAMRHAPPVADAVTLQRRFPDTESAKLALEKLVRAAPLDPDCAEIAAGHELRIRVPRQDAGRIESLLQSA